MNWRTFMTFSAALIGGVVSAQQRAHANFTTPQRSLRALGGRPTWVPICSRRGVNGSAAYYDAIDVSTMDQVVCYAPSWGTVSALKLVYAGFDVTQQGEIDRGITATIANASIFDPAMPSNQVYTSAPFTTSSTYINCSPVAGNGCNSVSAGQFVTSGGTYFAAGTYVTSVVNGFAAGAGNQPISTQINLSSNPTANNGGGLAVTFTGAIVPVHWGGNKGVVFGPAHDVITSDAATVSIPPNAQYFIRTAATMSSAGMQIQDYPGGFRYTGAQNEFDARGASLNDHTMDPTNLANTGGGFWGPVAVLGMVTTSGGNIPPGAVLVLGDSIATGTGDVPDALYLQGYIQRSLENNVPFVTAARGSTTAAEGALQGAGQFALATDTGITDVLLELGRNDIEQFSASAAGLEASITTIAARYSQAGKRVWCFTVPPTTISSDGWTTLANQSWIVTAETTSGSTPAGATSLTLSSVSGISAGQAIVIPPPTQSLNGTAVPAGSTIVTLASAASLYVGQAVYGPGVASGTVISGVSGNVLTLSKSTSGVIPAYSTLVFGTGLAPATDVATVNQATNVVTLSVPTVAAVASGAAVDTGQAVANPDESARETYNAYLRTGTGLAALGCYGLVDDDLVMADAGGSHKWRVDLGSASADGVHPASALHTAMVAARLITPAMFIPQ